MRKALNEAQEIINDFIKQQYGRGLIQSPYECGSYLDVIQIFDYTLDFWEDSVCNQELFDLIIRIKIYDVPENEAKKALKLIVGYIIGTNSLSWWCRPIYEGNLRYVLQRYFPANKPLNYDYLRYILNSDYLNQNEVEVTI